MPVAAPWGTPGAGTPVKRRVLTLLSGEPAGKISTSNAGAVSFVATLSWPPGDGIPAGPVLGEPVPGARFYSLVQTDDAASATRRVSCEIRALSTEQLTRASDGALRSATAHAALTEAVLEIQVVRLADPSEALAALVEELAWQLWEAKLPVSFGPSWATAPDAAVSVGVWGLEDAFQTFLRTHPAWRTPPHLSAPFAGRRKGSE